MSVSRLAARPSSHLRRRRVDGRGTDMDGPGARRVRLPHDGDLGAGHVLEVGPLGERVRARDRRPGGEKDRGGEAGSQVRAARGPPAPPPSSRDGLCPGPGSRHGWSFLGKPRPSSRKRTSEVRARRRGEGHVLDRRHVRMARGFAVGFLRLARAAGIGPRRLGSPTRSACAGGARARPEDLRQPSRPR